MTNVSQRGFFGVIIPLEILDLKELTPCEKFVYAYVASFTKCCFESNEKIAEKIGVSKETVSRALAKLSKMGFIFIEYIKNNSSKRRLYAIFENPRKLAFLAEKGMFKQWNNREEKQSFPQASQNDEPQIVASQNDEEASQNDEPQNRGEASQNDYHRIKEENKNKATPEQIPNTKQTHRLYLHRSDFEDEEAYEKEFYKRNTISVGAIS